MFCKCGCKGITSIVPFNGVKGYKKGEHYNYISGHNNKLSLEQKIERKIDRLTKKGFNIEQKCKCGCEKKVKLGNIYINGHNRKGRKFKSFTIEHKLKLRLSHLGKPSNHKGKKCSEKTKELIRMKRIFQKTPIFDTTIELKIKDFLKQLNINYEEHKPILDIKHFYPCDIFIKPNIIVECDGNYWHNYPNLREIDKIRNIELKEKNYKIIRLWESDIKKMNINNFIDIIGGVF